MEKSSKFLGSYKAVAGAAVAAADPAPFAELAGSSSKLVKLKKVKVSGLVLTAVGYLTILVNKCSALATGGTAVAMNEVPVLSSYPAAGAVARRFTAAPTIGTLVGVIAAKTVMGQSSTAAATALPAEVEFDFSEEEIYLTKDTEAIAVSFANDPATAVTLNIEFAWDEDSK